MPGLHWLSLAPLLHLGAGHQLLPAAAPAAAHGFALAPLLRAGLSWVPSALGVCLVFLWALAP